MSAHCFGGSPCYLSLSLNTLWFPLRSPLSFHSFMMLVDFAFSARKALPRKRRTNEVQVLGSFGRARGEGKWQNCPRSSFWSSDYYSIWQFKNRFLFVDSSWQHLKKEEVLAIVVPPAVQLGGESSEWLSSPSPTLSLLLQNHLLLWEAPTVYQANARCFIAGLLNHIPIKLVYKYVHQSPEHPAKRQTLIQHVWWWYRKDIS